MLEQRCNHSKQYRNNVATPCYGLREKSWLRIRLNVRIFRWSKIRPVAFLTFSLQLEKIERCLEMSQWEYCTSLALSVSQLEIWNREVSIVYNVDKFFPELTQVSMLAGCCCCWIVLILFNFQTVSFSAGAPVTSIIEMAISYNYEYLAMFTDTGLLWIGSADLQVGITLSHLFSPQFQLSEDEFQ